MCIDVCFRFQGDPPKVCNPFVTKNNQTNGPVMSKSDWNANYELEYEPTHQGSDQEGGVADLEMSVLIFGLKLACAKQ